MKRVSHLFLGVIFVFLACDDAPPPPDTAQALGSRVELAAGDVWLDKDGAKQRLITGVMLPEKARLEVGPGGRALLRLSTGAGAFLRSGSAVSLRETEFAMTKGEMWIDVPPGARAMDRFTAGSVTVTATDAGLDIAMDGNTVRVYVARGLAVVEGKGGRTEVQSGERVTVTGAKEPVVEPVDFWEDWTGGMADRELLAGLGGKAAGQIYGVDRSRPGSTPQALQILSQEVRAVIRDGIAHTVVDQRFFNPSSTPLEGWYWFTVPEGASVERFALEVEGVLVDGEMVERKQAKAAYEDEVRRAFDPALLEWIDGHTFRARIFPVPATGERRVVLAYSQLLPLADGAYRYVYPMASRGDVTIQEFSLGVDLGDKGDQYDIATLQEARVEADKSKVSMRRSGFSPRADFLLELKPTDPPKALRAMRFDGEENEADYVMLRYCPEVSWNSLEKVPGDVVVVLDTSAGGDDGDRQVRTDAVEAILRALSAGDRFAVVAADLKPRVVYPSKGLAKADDKNVSKAMEKLAEVTSAGATDLGQIFSKALDLLHDGEQPAVVYVGDGQATVGETSSRDLADRLRRGLGDSRARLFTIAVGADANVSLLARLARVGGGRLFQIATPEQTVQEALRFVGMLKTPTITDLVIDAGGGLDQSFTTASGKLSEGKDVILVARSHHALPSTVTVSGRLGGKPFENKYDIDVETGSEHGYIPVMWARQYLSRLMGDGLEENRGRIISLGLAYSLMTPFSSFLVLESDDAYERQGIKRRKRHRLTDLRTGREQEHWIARNKDVLAIPLIAFGCSAQEEESLKGEQVEQPALLKEERSEDDQGGQGKRHRDQYERKAPSSALDDDPLAGAFDLEGDSKSGSGRGAQQKKKASSSARPREPQLASAADKPVKVLKQARPSFQKAVCSDASRRPLNQRRLLWQRQLERVGIPEAYAAFFFAAGQRCELPRWRDQRVMLDLIEKRVHEPRDVNVLLSSFNRYTQVQNYLRRKILRRVLDPSLAFHIGSLDTFDWTKVASGMAAMKTPEARLKALRPILEKHPTDPIGRALLVRILFAAGLDREAMNEASRLRRDRLANPLVLEILCDLQAEADMVDEARRTCSELVEYNDEDPETRKRLGDLFLRHGWYEAAYRQYQSLVAMQGDTPLALLRLAAAAAGMGKVDEALRIERKVAAGDGEPGPKDPRRSARLLSVARLAEMLLKARKDKKESTVAALTRSLKRTQVFSARTTLVLLVFEDFAAGLNLALIKDAVPSPVTERVDGKEMGLVMLDFGLSTPDSKNLTVQADDKSLRRNVGYALVTIAWDGKDFKIVETKGKVAPSAL